MRQRQPGFEHDCRDDGDDGDDDDDGDDGDDERFHKVPFVSSNYDNDPTEDEIRDHE